MAVAEVERLDNTEGRGEKVATVKEVKRFSGAEGRG